MSESGIVVIGRNEGSRLRRCLESALSATSTVVYVDSGSSDDSVELARKLGAQVVELTDGPFTAARARNAGLQRLLADGSQIEFVQFLDGDTEMQPGWFISAMNAMQSDTKAAVVCGRRRERHPQHSVYNLLADLEWDTPVGEACECGGDAMFRVTAFQQVHGFDPTLIAGEEPDLCVRLRERGWTVQRLNAEMTLHDAAMLSFKQWWRRNVRNGHAFAEGAARHGRGPMRHWLRQTRSNWLWGLIVPLVSIVLAPLTLGISLLLLLIYPLMSLRVYLKCRQRWSASHCTRAYAFFCMLGKFPQVQGQLLYHWRRARNVMPHLIEYKGAAEPTTS